MNGFSGNVDLTSETDIAAILASSSYTPDQDAHNDHADITDQLSTANGYTEEDGSGSGKILTSTTLGASANVITFDSGNPSWTATGAGFTARRIVLCDVTSGVSATSPLILWSDFGQDETASGGGSFTYTVNASGWGSITAGDAP